MLHRPKEYIGDKYGVDYPSIWVKFSDDLLNWEDKESHLLLTGRENSWEEKIGGSTPPLKTKEGWLMLYHGVESGGLGYYRVGALLLDSTDPMRIIRYWSRKWILKLKDITMGVCSRQVMQ